MGCNSNTASLEINKKFKKSRFYQRQWACYFEFSAEPKSEQRGTRGALCCWEDAEPRSLLLQSVQCPSLRVFYTGIGKKETLFSKNSALSQLDKHLKIKAPQLKLAVHPHSFVSLFIFFPHPSTCVLQPMVITPSRMMAWNSANLHQGLPALPCLKLAEASKPNSERPSESASTAPSMAHFPFPLKLLPGIFSFSRILIVSSIFLVSFCS